MTYAPKKDGATIKELPTREQCAVEAFERGMVVSRGADFPGDSAGTCLVHGAEIVAVNDNAAPTTLADLVGAGVVYVASPYTHYPYGHEAAAQDAGRVTAALMRMGICAYSPIVHSHAVAHVGGLNKVDGAFWQRMDAPMVDAAEACIVVKMPGWDTSKGVTHEIAEFTAAGKPIVYLDDGEVG